MPPDNSAPPASPAPRWNYNSVSPGAPWVRWRTPIVHALLATFFAACCFRAFSRPLHNWDLLGYLGNVVSLTESDPGSIHRKTYALAQAGMPAAHYAALMESADGFRAAVATSPEILGEQLQFYRPRFFYLGLLALGAKLGLEPVALSVGLSSLSVFLAFLLLQRWFSRYSDAIATAAVLVPLFLGAGFYNLAKLSTPDATAFLLLLLGAYGLVHTSRKWVPLLYWSLAVATRTDTAVFIAVFFTLHLFVRAQPCRHPLWLVALGAVAPLGLAIALNRAAGNTGWAVLIHHCFLGQLYYPVSRPPQFYLPDYWPILTHGFGDFFAYAAYPVMLAVSLFGAFAGGLSACFARPLPLMALTAAVSSLARYALFPASDPRYVLPTLTLGVVAGLLALISAAAPRHAPA